MVIQTIKYLIFRNCSKFNIKYIVRGRIGFSKGANKHELARIPATTCYYFLKNLVPCTKHVHRHRNIANTSKNKVKFVSVHLYTVAKKTIVKKKKERKVTNVYIVGFKMPVDQIQYSEKYSDDKYEYRHVILPLDLARHVPKTHLMSETEWRNLGVQQSPGWVHYMMHVPEPHVLLFRRPRTDCLITTRSTSFQREY
ncbi:uncharacterized protein LOC128881877 isoform X1 [Hylaeus volcanicus]|uniref:uncharacterized protein LOC128881877 isoform X1 n=2 Tax=Hylaeus volcanicus TaxID=313075 RepID=UPI0023B8776D|nr:uncharacterized protein LOC128881877 isoform X1 [Hylaeus volcanicus]XP_053989235.1 uncharacterized protein LOC128881877 isoform X1 [Hylaeus volcanicus]XP_053989236.1 uncharacterized protein LOC128881877 isoform X1 [Hylaeus volcanicus]